MGKVLSVQEVSASTNQIGIVRTNYRVEVEVLSVEKGKFLSKSDKIKVSCWRHTYFPEAVRQNPNLTVGENGHRPIPATGNQVRAFLVRDGLRWAAVYPSGFEILPGDVLP